MGQDEETNNFNGGTPPVTPNPRAQFMSGNRLGMRPARDLSAAEELNRIVEAEQKENIEANGGDIILAPTGKQPKDRKIIVIIVLAIAIVITFTVGILLSIMRNKAVSGDRDAIGTSSVDILFDEKAYIPYMNNDGMYGYINPENGEVVISAKYNLAKRFYGDYAAVVYDGGAKSAIIDKNGTVKVAQDNQEMPDEVRYDVENNLWYANGGVYNSRLEKITPDNVRSSYIGNGYSYNIEIKTETANLNEGTEGKDEIITKNTKPKGSTDGSAASTTSGTSGNAYITDKDQNVIYTCKGACGAATTERNGVYYAVIKNWGEAAKIINLSTKDEIYSARDDNAIAIIDDGVFYEKDEYLVADGSTVSKQKTYSHEKAVTISGMNEYSIKVCDDGRYGVLNNNDTVLDCAYRQIVELSKNAYKYFVKTKDYHPVIVVNNEKAALYDLKSRREIMELPVGQYEAFSDSLIVSVEKDDGKKALCSLKKSDNYCAEIDQEGYIEVDEVYAKVSNGSGLSYYNLNLKEYKK